MTRVNPWLQHFIPALIESSKDETYNKAIEEWELDHVYECEQYGDENCVCTHEIQEVYVVRNKINGNKLNIGNCCISKFNIAGGKDTVKAINSLKKDKLNRPLILLAYKRDLIDEWSKDFLLDIKRKKLLTEKQHYWKNRLMKQIKDGMMNDDKYVKEWYEKDEDDENAN
jgi:hypothetical protein